MLLAAVVSCSSSESELSFSGEPTALPHAAVRPSASQDDRDRALIDFYRAWKDEYVHEDCGDGAYQIYSPDAAYPFVSEAQGYGLTIAAMMSGADPDARDLFDGLLTYVLDHPSTRTPDLMAAEQDADCVDKAGGDSATDGDMDVAYGLLLADRLWGSDGDVDYRDLAVKRIRAVKDKTVNPSSELMLLGDWDTTVDPQLYATTRTSDWMPYYFRVFQEATGDTAWSAIADAHRSAVADLRDPDTGLLPDFARTGGDGIEPVTGKVLETANDGDYSFNACRVPWRLGTDALLTGDASSTSAARTIDAWFRSTTGGDPGRVGSGYRLDGTREDADESNAFWAPLAVSAMTDPGGQRWLDALWTKLAENDVERGNYYGDTIQLQVMLLLSGRYLTV
ncbi:glycosyl hydrolase family 8 [Cryptosporangium arvum]|uniref:Endoglucanase Y n=1 Tax=Cryptosporangium arvum DSM 44712 TaxID=927661 RepID=A0A011A033_9ACTN|nr:glycosyl hydrolase family 8 [Cryptosporangium arvum]EXG82832.1 endoglucanase Y [Cryptosporangium arvum DSM 44712]